MISIEQYDSHIFGITSRRYSAALHKEAKATPGLGWIAQHHAWCGYADAVAACVKRLEAQEIIVNGEAPKAKYGLFGDHPLSVPRRLLDSLRKYQIHGVQFLVDTAATGALLADDMGLGKTAQTIRAVGALQRSALIVCPSFVRTVWAREIAKWLPKSPIVELSGTKPKVADEDRLRVNAPTFFICHYDIVHAWTDLIANIASPEIIVFDECFPAGTQVANRLGTKPIESIRPGDRVKCAVGFGQVQNVGCRNVALTSLRRVQLDDGREFICTKDHPILALRPLTEMPYWCAVDDLLPGSFILDSVRTQAVFNWGESRRVSSPVAAKNEGEEALQALFAGREDEARSLLLLSVLRREMACSPTEVSNKAEESSAGSETSCADVEANAGSARTEPDDGSGKQPPDETAESDALGDDTREGDERSSSAGRLVPKETRRQWQATTASRTNAGEGSRLTMEANDNQHQNNAWIWGARPLQDRSGPRAEEDRSGGRRSEPLLAEGSRPSKGPFPPLARVVCVAVPEPADFARLGLRGPDDQGRVLVYNLEVDTHPSYVVNGVVVHNCHYLMSEKSRRSLACRELARKAQYRIGLSGTPMTSRPRDLWNVVDTLSEGRFGKPFGFFLTHCNAHKVTITTRQGDRIVWDLKGASNLDELHARLEHFMLRRTKSDVELELPPRTRQVVEVEVPRETRAPIGNALKSDRTLRDALALAADGKIPKAIELIANHIESGSKVVVFSHRRAVAEVIAASLKSSGVNAKVITGEVLQKRRVEIIDEQPTVLCATLDSTSVGIDLSYADVAVFVELDYVPSKLAQGESRLHRFGQKRNVLIQYVIALSTVDEVIQETVISKLDTFEQVVGGLDDGLKESLKGQQLDDVSQLRKLYEKMKAREDDDKGKGESKKEEGEGDEATDDGGRLRSIHPDYALEETPEVASLPARRRARPKDDRSVLRGGRSSPQPGAASKVRRKPAR